MSTYRQAPIEIQKAEFKSMGYRLVDAIADFLDTIAERPVTPGENPDQVQRWLPAGAMPEEGRSAGEVVAQATEILLNHSLLNGHPRFLGYITSSAAPIGALADLLAAAVNPNVGAQILSPAATAIEKQTVQWLAEFIGLSPTYGGIFVSGGNMANFTAFLAARTAKAPPGFQADGIRNDSQKLLVYCSKATHTWIEKAAALFGHGTHAIRWIPTDAENKMDIGILDRSIAADVKAGSLPFLVVGTAGDVSTGVVDNLSDIAAIAKRYDLWFHIDGAYGVPAAVVPELKALFDGMQEADSIAMDPHKWLYSPLEAGCTLVKNPSHLIDTFSAHPEYYNFSSHDETVAHNFYEYGLQNSRGFKALKVWLMLQQVGRRGYVTMIREDVGLAKLLWERAETHPELEAITQHLSITTFRYVPRELPSYNGDALEKYLNTLNEALLNDIQQGGELFLSNAVVRGKYCLRGCIVNFRTSPKDIDEMIEIIVRLGRKVLPRVE